MESFMPDGLHVFYYLSVKIPCVLWKNVFYRKGGLSKNEYNLKIL